MTGRIGVTGATGFIGRHLVAELVRNRMQVVALTRTLADMRDPSPLVEWRQGDLSIAQHCDEFVRDVDVVVHLAHANTPLNSNGDLPADAALNMIPTLTLVQAIRNVGRRTHVVYASSGGAVYGPLREQRAVSESDSALPLTSYGVQKLAAEHYLRLGASKGWLTGVALRIGNAYGRPLPRERLQGFIGVAMAAHARGEPIRVFGSEDNVRDYVHLDDVARAVLAAAGRPHGFEVYNIGSGRGVSVRELIALIERISERPLELERVSVDASDLPDWIVLDVDKAQRELGWAPQIDIAEGLSQLWRKLVAA